MPNYLHKTLIVIFLSSLLFPPLVGGQVITIPNPLQASNFTELINSLVNIIFYFAVAIAPIFIIIAGLYFITAAGEPAKINTAKQIILWTLIGLAIVTAAKGIINLFRTVFGI